MSESARHGAVVCVPAARGSRRWPPQRRGTGTGLGLDIAGAGTGCPPCPKASDLQRHRPTCLRCRLISGSQPLSATARSFGRGLPELKVYLNARRLIMETAFGITFQHAAAFTTPGFCSSELTEQSRTGLL